MEMKSKLLKRFPKCYKLVCLCWNRRKLMREQQVAASSEKNKDLISRLEAIRVSKNEFNLALGAYINKLEKNEYLVELNLLDEMANDFNSTLARVSEWKENH